MVYSNINDVGKQWIRKYTLALSKELLGMVRSKYGTIPIPNAEVSLMVKHIKFECSRERTINRAVKRKFRTNKS